jgi:hypothetical protein
MTARERRFVAAVKLRISGRPRSSCPHATAARAASVA